MEERTLQTVVIALHAKGQHIEEMFEWFDLQRSRLTVEETRWPHVASSDERLRLVFGRTGLKRVVATHLPTQLAAAGFRYQGVSLERQKVVYTKKEVRYIRRLGYEYAHEGRPKVDGRGDQIRKEALLFTFHRVQHPDDFIHPHVHLLGSLLQDCGWRRARVLEQFELDEPSNGVALVELVLLNVISDSATELHYGANTGFWSEPYRQVACP